MALLVVLVLRSWVVIHLLIVLFWSFVITIRSFCFLTIIFISFNETMRPDTNKSGVLTNLPTPTDCSLPSLLYNTQSLRWNTCSHALIILLISLLIPSSVSVVMNSPCSMDAFTCLTTFSLLLTRSSVGSLSVIILGILARGDAKIQAGHCHINSTCVGYSLPYFQAQKNHQ